MTRILVCPERLTDVGQRLISEGEYLVGMGQRLSGTVSRLDWESRVRIGMEDDFAVARGRAESLGRRLITHGQRLIEVGERFERADSEAAQDVVGIPWSTLLDGILDAADIYDKLDRWFDLVVGVPASLLVAARLVEGTTYADQVIFVGSQRLKGWAGVSPYLTHIGSEGIPAHMARKAARHGLGWGPLMLEGLDEARENWEEYGGDVPKVATGIMVDTLLSVGCVYLGTGLLALFGGMVAGPPGAVVGGRIGGIVGSWAAERVENVRVGDRELDQAVVEALSPYVDQALSPCVEAVARLF